jgi:hypothetical protein
MTDTFRDRERFWIALTVRLAFGFMFIIAAMNIFTYADTKNPPPEKTRYELFKESLTGFADDLGGAYQNTWVNFKWKWFMEADPTSNQPVAIDLGIRLVKGFLYAMPFIFTILGLCILSGIWLYPALRFASIYLVILGLGKYITGDGATTAQDFIYAAFICIGLYMSSGRRDEKVAAEALE